VEAESRGRVLVVEDDENTRAAYRAVLELAGWTVDEATGGDEALRLAELRPPRLALVDISIPGIDGWETTRRLKGGSAPGEMTVIAVTGHALDDDRRRAREAGCDAYLVKPITPRQLLTEIERLTGAAA
jgi:two-component system cell cycle response regulator DivK